MIKEVRGGRWVAEIGESWGVRWVTWVDSWRGDKPLAQAPSCVARAPDRKEKGSWV